MKIKAYKGFSKNMRCRGFQYEEGKTYELPENERAVLCGNGFHACQLPVDCFRYYFPTDSKYHEVELDANYEHEDFDSKRVGYKIKIGSELRVPDMICKSVTHILEHQDNDVEVTTEHNCSVIATKNQTTALTTGEASSANATEDYSRVITTGAWSHAGATGDKSLVCTSGNLSNATVSGESSGAVTTGSFSHAIASGTGSLTFTFASFSNAVATGEGCAAAVNAPDSIACAIGLHNMAKGPIDSWLVLGEYTGIAGADLNLKCVKAVRVDGEKIKADTWYFLKNGEFVEVFDK